MFPAGGFQTLRLAAFLNEDDAATGRDAADAADGDSCDAHGDCPSSRSGEEQFVVFASVEGEVQGNGLAFGSNHGSRNSYRFEFGSDFRFFADLGEVGGEAVAHIDHGRGFPAQRLSDGDARDGMEVAGEIAGANLLSSEEGF